MRAPSPVIRLPYEVILYLLSRVPRTPETIRGYFHYYGGLEPIFKEAEKLQDSPLPSSYDKTALYPIDKEVIEGALLLVSRDDRIKLCAYFDPLLDICKELFPEEIHFFSVPEELLSFPEEEYPVVPRRPISPPRRRTPRYYKPREQIRYPERPLSPPRESSRRPSYRYEEERVSRPTTLRETLRPSYRYEEERLPPPPSYPPPPPPVEPSEGEISRPTTLRGTPQSSSRLPRIPLSAVYPRK